MRKPYFTIFNLNLKYSQVDEFVCGSKIKLRVIGYFKHQMNVLNDKFLFDNL